MSQHTDWTVEPRDRGWLARLIAPQEGDRPSSMPLLLGALGAAAYVASLALDWQKITVEPLTGDGPPPQQTAILTAGLGDIATLSLAFVLGGIALLALVGTVATRPEVALRLRMTTMGVGVGLVGVLLAITIRMPNTYLAVQGFAEAIFGGGPEAFQDRMTKLVRAGHLLRLCGGNPPASGRVARRAPGGPAAARGHGRADAADGVRRRSARRGTGDPPGAAAGRPARADRQLRRFASTLTSPLPAAAGNAVRASGRAE